MQTFHNNNNQLIVIDDLNKTENSIERANHTFLDRADLDMNVLRK